MIELGTDTNVENRFRNKPYAARAKTRLRHCAARHTVSHMCPRSKTGLVNSYQFGKLLSAVLTNLQGHLACFSFCWGYFISWNFHFSSQRRRNLSIFVFDFLFSFNPYRKFQWHSSHGDSFPSPPSDFLGAASPFALKVAHIDICISAWEPTEHGWEDDKALINSCYDILRTSKVFDHLG